MSIQQGFVFLNLASSRDFELELRATTRANSLFFVVFLHEVVPFIYHVGYGNKSYRNCQTNFEIRSKNLEIVQKSKICV